MAVPCSAAAAPRAAGNSPSATKEPSATPSDNPFESRRGFRFPKSCRLLHKGDFRRVYDGGFRLTAPSFAVFCLNRNDGGGPRVGFTAPRALGKSVERNRIRRRIREAVRLELWRLQAPVDVIFHPRRTVWKVDLEELRRQVAEVFQRCAMS